MSSKSPQNRGQPQAKKSVPATPDQEGEKLTLLKNPVRTLQLFFRVFFRNVVAALNFVLRHGVAFGVLALAIILPHVIHGPHTPIVKKVDEIAEFAGYWIILGVASSIGLGTGLHTFVLYLGPHIAKVAMVANECNAIPEYLPSRWAINPTFGLCPPGERPQISFWTILMQVQIEAFLWGLGTALGELPPYFVARAASKAGKKEEELEELEKGGSAASLLDRAKVLIYKGLKRYGFITVLLCASIPNPLFDLAGVTCGHFGISFWNFFTATAIGKAIIKVHLQMLFVIFVFSRHHIEHILEFIGRKVPFLHGKLEKALEEQKKLLHAPKDLIQKEKPLVAQLWDYFILAMILFFVSSIITSLANGELEREENEKAGRPNRALEAKRSEKEKKKQ